MGEAPPTPKADVFAEDTGPEIPVAAKVPLGDQDRPSEPLPVGKKPVGQNLPEGAATSSALKDESNLIKYSIEYVGLRSGTFSVDGRAERPDVSEEPSVLEYVEVRLSSQDVLSAKIEEVSKTEKGKGNAYINIISPAVTEALRCVVEYFPGIDFTQSVIKVYEPYTVFVFYEKELTAYRERLAKAAEESPMTCINRWADKHIGIVQDFVRQRTKDAVDAERERHSRGFATYDMLWLLFKPGSDVYVDFHDVGEHEPYVVSEVRLALVNGTTNFCRVVFWNMDADSRFVYPVECSAKIDRFDGEKSILALVAYPCEYLALADDVDENDLAAIKQHFTNRGKKWYNLRRNVGSHDFDGYTVSLPRRRYSSLTMVDPIQYSEWTGNERCTSFLELVHPVPLKICSCAKCDERIYQHVGKPKFIGYDEIIPLVVENLTDHQYFLCDSRVEAFLFKVRSWQILHVDGFRDPTFDGALFERLVMKDSTKQLIKNLTAMYIRDGAKSVRREENVFTKVNQVHKKAREKKIDTTWSADFIEGKGEGLTMLLHGRPGVGKTYTVECIADYTGRPLLSLTCSDIGVKPEEIEGNLLKWFKLAEIWGVVMLIDEADIYMEQRQVQDVARNHLVAGFLRALEYYKGILFLTTNRVGTFDEAFISRIHVQIYYPDFQDAERDRLWDSFFQKLEDDRESTMRIAPSAKDYVQTQELRSLEWNGREIRNAFQVAVALAEAQKQTDSQGRVIIKSDHIKATVQMSSEFQVYLRRLHKGSLSKKASIMGNRYDAFDKEAERSEKH